MELRLLKSQKDLKMIINPLWKFNLPFVQSRSQSVCKTDRPNTSATSIKDNNSSMYLTKYKFTANKKVEEINKLDQLRTTMNSFSTAAPSFRRSASV